MTDTTDTQQTDEKIELESKIEPLQKQAVESALRQDWEAAISVNSKILKLDKGNIGALNRLGFAYMNAGKKDEAKKTFDKVKKLDPYNAIANKNLAKLETSKGAGVSPVPSGALVSPLMFLEDPGKTKIVQCVNLAPAQALSLISCGQEVYLKPKNHTIEVRDQNGLYLGALPDDVSFRLIKYLAGNNEYKIYVKSVDKKTFTVFIREMTRGKKFINQPSFASSQIIQSYVREVASDADQEKPDVSATGEEAEPEEES